jgi:hypothetical protein
VNDPMPAPLEEGADRFSRFVGLEGSGIANRQDGASRLERSLSAMFIEVPSTAGGILKSRDFRNHLIRSLTPQEALVPLATPFLFTDGPEENSVSIRTGP